MKRWSRFAGALGAAALTAFGPSSAAKADSIPSPAPSELPWTTVRVVTPECETSGFGASAFTRLLDIELHSEELKTSKRGNETRPVELIVTIEASVCDVASHDLEIRLRRSDGGTELKRFIDIGDVALNARLRALALAVAEQVRQSRTSGDFDKKAPERAVDPSPTWSEPATPRRQDWVNDRPTLAAQRLGPDVTATAAWRTFFGPTTSLWGGNLAFSLPLKPSWLRARADLGGQATGFTDELGEADLVHLAAGFALLAATPRGTLFAGPRVELGWANIVSRTTAHAATPRSASAGTVLTSVVAGTRLPIESNFGLILEVEGGFAARGVSVLADDRTLGALRGGYGTVRAGLALTY